MFENIKKKNINMIIAIIGLTVILLWGISSLISLNAKTTKSEIKIEDYKSYIKDENLIKDYTQFNRAETVMNMYIEGLLSKDDKTTYSVLTKSLKKEHSFFDYKKKIKEYISKNFKSTKDNDFYINENNLFKLYKIADKNGIEVYLAEIKTISENTFIGFQLDTRSKVFKISYLEI
ncbi:MAG: hypothetical protein RR922_00855 [Clostridia bacterium]